MRLREGPKIPVGLTDAPRLSKKEARASHDSQDEASQTLGRGDSKRQASLLPLNDGSVGGMQ